MKYALALVLFLGIAGTAKADILNISTGGEFHVNLLNSNAPHETFNMSVDWDTIANAIVPGTLTDNFAGPLQNFSLSVFVVPIYNTANFVPVFDWFDQNHDLIQLHLGLHETNLYGTHPTSELGLYALGGWSSSPTDAYLRITPVNAPEMSTLSMLLAGLAFAAGWCTVRRKQHTNSTTV